MTIELEAVKTDLAAVRAELNALKLALETAHLIIDDLRVKPNIKRGCRRCGVTDAEVNSGWVVISPSGLAHHGEDYGATRCGLDATGNGWWWPV